MRSGYAMLCRAAISRVCLLKNRKQMALARVLKQGPDELILAVRGFAEALEATNTAVDAEVERGQRERERERASAEA